MKKVISLIMILILYIFSTSSYAAVLDTIDITVDKKTVMPGEEIKLDINFGKELSAYTFDIAYDNKIFDFVSVAQGDAKISTDKVTVTFNAKTNLRKSMSIIFKAKEDITSTNPTEFTVVGNSFIGPSDDIVYDDITVPIVKNIIVEPEYIEYSLNFTHEGNIIPEEEKDVKLSIISKMGRYYEHARLIVEATKPDGANVELIGINEEENVKQDLIKSGWGDPQGYEIGGKNYSQILNLKALFSKEGEYTLTFKLIDRDNSDSIISEKQYKIMAQKEKIEEPVLEPSNNTTINELPKKLPKTGFNLYIPYMIVIGILVLAIIYYNKKRKN